MGVDLRTFSDSINPKRQLAIMRNVGIGMRDTNAPCLWFDTQTTESIGALQVLSWADAEQVIRKTGVYKVESLEGWPCWVEQDHGILRFIEAWRAGS